MSDSDERDERNPGTEPAPDEPARAASGDAGPTDDGEEVTRQLPAIAPGAAVEAEPEGDPMPAHREPPGDIDLSPHPATADAPAGAASAPEDAPVRVASEVESPDSAPSPAPEPVTARRVAVVRLSGADDGEVTSVSGDRIIIGRLAPDLTVALPHDQWVSRRHAEITFRDGQWWIQDLGSANGAFLDGQRVSASEPTALPLGAVFHLGHTDLMLTDEPDHLSHGATAL